MVSVLKLSKCRLCMKLGDFYSIFTFDNDLQLADMAMACSRIKIFEGDGLPDKICGECVGKLSSSFIFKQQCERSDSELRKSMPGLSQPDSSPGVRCNSDSGFSNRTDNSSSKNSKDKEVRNQENRAKKRKVAQSDPIIDVLLKESFSLNLGNPKEYEGLPKKKSKGQYDRSDDEDDEDDGDVSDMSDRDFQGGSLALRCDACPASFRTQKDLTLHKTIHKEEKKSSDSDTQDSYVSDGKSLGCQYCKKSFKLKIMLNRHMEKCTNRTYPPPVVPNIPPKIPKAPKRLVYAHDLKCGECGRVFWKRVNLRRHMRKVHDKSPPPMTAVEVDEEPPSTDCDSNTVGICPGCPEQFETYEDAKSHLLNCEAVKSMDRLVCKLCSCPAISNIKALLIHLCEKHMQVQIKTESKNESEMQCRFCGESFEEQEDLVQHLAAHMAKMDASEAESSLRENMESPVSLECRLCSRTFREKIYLDKHIETQHLNQAARISDSGRTELKCDQCEKTFFYKQSLLTHKAVKHGIAEKNAEKDGSAEGSVSMVQIPNAYSDEAKNGGPALTIESCQTKCSICGKEGTVRDMKGHGNIHKLNNLKPSNEYTCIGCGLTFTSLKIMRIHFREHRPVAYPAPSQQDNMVDPSNFCEVVVANVKLEPDDSGYDFGNTSAQDRNDTKYKPNSVPVVNLQGFTCPHCGKIMETMSSLTYHIRWHNTTGHKLEKHLQCKICNEAFKYNSHYREHIKHHSRDLTLDPKFRTCAICGRLSIHLRAHEAHMSWHKQARFAVGEIPCPICKRVLPNNRIFKYHMRCHQKKGDIQKGVDKINATEGGEDNKCGLCGKIMANETSLKHHMAWHNSKTALFMQRHECDVCKKWFTNKRRYEIHMRRHTNSNLPFKCDTCFKGFKSEHLRDNHAKMHTVNIWKTNEMMKNKLQKIRENSVACPVCDKLYPNQLKLHGHLKLKHPQSRMVKKNDPGAEPAVTYTCNICGKEFPNLRYYNNHLKTHTRKPNHFVKCKLCKKNSYSIKFHNIHIKSHLVQKFHNNPLKCPHCDETFILGYALHYHLRDAHQINEDYIMDRTAADDESAELEEFQCHICKKVLASRGNFERHLDYHNSLTCDYCSERFRKMEFLEAHLKLNCDRKKSLGNATAFNKTLKCTICYKAFSLQIKLNCHLKTKHELEPEVITFTRQKTVVCDFCFSEFADDAAMQVHKNIHLRFLTNYGCKYCPRKFNTVTAFKKHKNHHLQRNHVENPLRCDDCGETFIPFYEYMAHLRDVHGSEPDMMIQPQESPVEKCPICSKEFNHMQNHLRFHEKCRCTKCREYFFSASAFNAHVCDIDSDDETTPETPAEECTYCFKPFSRNKAAHLANHAKASFVACRMCPLRFKNNETFRQHVYKHTNRRNYAKTPLQCRHCPQRFTKYTHYVKHNRIVHNIKESLAYRPELPHEKCVVCDRVMPNLANHYRYHLTLRCGKCGVYILSGRLFQTHTCDSLPDDPDMWRKSDADLEQIIKELSVRVYENFICSDKPMEPDEEYDQTIESADCVLDDNTQNNAEFKPIISDTVSLRHINEDSVLENSHNELKNAEGDTLNDILDSVMRMSQDSE